ncbi:MAG: choice-of-anchor L domain-containing protein [Actinomycetota bacterium]
MRRATIVGIVLTGLLMTAGSPARADHSIGAAGAGSISTAIARDASVVTGAGFEPGTALLTNANAAPSVPLTAFPTHGATYGILTTGDARFADHPGTFQSSGGGGSFRGANDVTILRVDLSVPAGQNCLSVDFQFFSEEFPVYVGTQFNDAFIAELDESTWTIVGSSITAPDNFAFDPDGNVISINSTGVASMNADNGAGTAYDTGDPSTTTGDGGATTLLRASTPITPGPHAVYFSIFDQGDSSLDSAVFLDNLSLGTTGEGGCQPGATLPPPIVSKTADSASTAPGGSNGYTITVTNPNDVPVSLDTITDTLPQGFLYTAGSTTGAVTTNPVVDGQALTWQGVEGPLVQVPSNGSISLHFGVTVSSVPGEYLNDAVATASGFAIQSTGPTAPITVTEPEPPPPPPPVDEPCDPVTLEGTGAGETLLGTAGADRIRGLAGRDRVDALGGDDELCGGLGGDYLYGRDGVDSLRGEEGNDRLYGGRGGDVLEGGPGHDAIIGGRGPDTILAADGTKDCIVTGKGNDSVTADPFDVVDPKKGCPPGFWL